MTKRILYTALVFLLANFMLQAQTPEEKAKTKIATLQRLINETEALGLDAARERLAMRTAEVFLEFANWDEVNVDVNKGYFEKVNIYKDQAATMAANLPNFERNDVNQLLNEAIATITQVKAGTIVRKPTPMVDWSGVTHNGDQLTYQNRPVFLADYTWRPKNDQLNEFYGELDGFFVTPSYVENETGKIRQNVLNNLDSKPSGTPGFIFIAQKSPPAWTSKYGADFTEIQGAPFHDYDIDNPGARELMTHLLSGTVAKMAGKNYAQLGYMLCNEPRWITYKNGTKKVWYNGGVSNYTKEKFKTWLAKKHSTIADLNTLWGTNFANFVNVQLDIPIDISLAGTPQWYDWSMFNNDRVTEWFTFMKAELRKHDPAAKAHLKIMPSFFTDNDPCTGIDLEALTQLSDIIGNDVAAKNNVLRGEMEWSDRYAFDWRELYMAYDFLKSVNPDQIIFNTESHLLTTSNSRDLYLDPAYVRATFWGAHTIGLNASQIWYWPRRESGALRSHDFGAYPGSNNQQPRVTNEVHATLMDLNSYSEEITAMQRQRKPLRIFYSKTSAANNLHYMDGVFELYEALNFSGVSLGFATENIIKRHANTTWDAILVHKTETITADELASLQTYLDNGGTIITDATSLKKNEYGAALTALKPSNGTLTIVNSLAELKTSALSLLAAPALAITETNTVGTDGCTWKCVQNQAGNQVLSVINLGKSAATLRIQLKNATRGTKCIDLLTGKDVNNTTELAPYEVLFVEILDEKPIVLGTENGTLKKKDFAQLITKGNDDYAIEMNEPQAKVTLTVTAVNGGIVSRKVVKNTQRITTNLYGQSAGVYLMHINTGKQKATYRCIKK